MKIYNETDAIIEAWQWGDPGLRNITDIIVRYLRGKSGRVIDAGCGTGRVSIALARAGFDVVGLDSDPRVIQIAERISIRLGTKVKYLVVDLTSPGRPALDQFEFAICSEVLEHIENYRAVLSSIHTLLKDGGIFLLTVPREMRLYTVLDAHSGHLRRFTFPELKEDLKGFEIIDHFTVGFPSIRFLVRSYVTALRVFHLEHKPQELWSSTGFRLIASSFVYRLTKLDNCFNRAGLISLLSLESFPVLDHKP
jgi:SAM-dependent methyltransferase